MTRHSKGCQNLSFFTNRQRIKFAKGYGTLKSRLSKNSIKNFDSCSICLKQAINPVCCEKGHIFCRECALCHILEHKKSHKRSKTFYKEQMKKKNEESLEENNKREMEENKSFKKLNSSLLPSDRHKDEIFTNVNKYSKCFWIQHPKHEENYSDMKKPELSKKAICPQSFLEREKHNMTLKTLIKVNFLSELSDDKNNRLMSKIYHCKICTKKLTNLSKITLLNKCGHTFCKNCMNQIKDESKNCYFCDKTYTTTINLESGGSGFAAHGNPVEAKKYTLPLP